MTDFVLVVEAKSKDSKIFTNSPNRRVIRSVVLQYSDGALEFLGSNEFPHTFTVPYIDLIE